MLLITPFQRTALQMLAEGRSNRDIARRLCVTDRELDSLLATLYARMGMTSQVDAIADAVRRGLVWMPAPPPPASDGRSDGR